MTQEQMKQLAMDLMRVGVSHDGVTQLLLNYTPEEIERQLRYLPFRKAKRPEAFIIEAIRKNYSAPKEFFHAKTQAKPTNDSLDENPKPSPGPSPADFEGYRAEAAPGSAPEDDGLEPGEPIDLDDLPDFDPQVR